MRYLTKREIMEMICITSARFKWWVKKLKIKTVLETGRLIYYTVQNMIDLYVAIYKRSFILESKMNYNIMPL